MAKGVTKNYSYQICNQSDRYTNRFYDKPIIVFNKYKAHSSFEKLINILRCINKIERLENIMKSIIVILPYFGMFPNYFSLFLKSCAVSNYQLADYHRPRAIQFYYSSQ